MQKKIKKTKETIKSTKNKTHAKRKKKTKKRTKNISEAKPTQPEVEATSQGKTAVVPCKLVTWEIGTGEERR